MTPDLAPHSPIIIMKFYGVGGLAGVSLCWDQGVWRLHSFADSRGSVSWLLPVGGRCHVLAGVGLRSPFSCWLSAGSCTRLPEAAHTLAGGLLPPRSSPATVGAVPLRVPSSSFSSLWSCSPISRMPVIRSAHPDNPDQSPAQGP